MSHDDGPAFPFQHELTGGGLMTASGMSLRDYFAAHALTAVGIPHIESVAQWSPEEIALSAYLIADAMLAERAK